MNNNYSQADLDKVLKVLERIAAMEDLLPSAVPISQKQFESMANALGLAITLSKLTLKDYRKNNKL